MALVPNAHLFWHRHYSNCGDTDNGKIGPGGCDIHRRYLVYHNHAKRVLISGRSLETVEQRQKKKRMRCRAVPYRCCYLNELWTEA